MRLTSKVGVATVLGIGVVLLVYGYLRVQRESAAFELDMRRDHRTLGMALGLMAHSAAQRVGPESALAMLDDTNQRRSDISIAFRADSAAKGASASSWVESNGGDRFLVSRIPANVGAPGYLVLRESMVDEDSYVRDTKRRVVTMTIVIALCSAVIIFGLGIWFIGRPLRKLVNKARRIGRGDLDEPLVLGQRDEIGELAAEVNAMCESLAAARAANVRETERRVSALEQLRHAERLITVGELAAGVAHEIGTPLNVVLARGRMVADGESEAAAARRDGRIICEQVERIARIIQSLLDFARQRRPQTMKTDLSTLCASTVDLLAALARKGDVRLKPPEGGPCPATVDPGQVQQVLINLIMNAVQAEPPGGVVAVSIERAASLPEELAAARSPFYRVRVEDHGPGMAAEVRRRAFEPFFTTKDVGQGTGLGLSVAHGIVQEHGGAIHIDSEPGLGTRVDVYLPAQRPEA